MKDKKIKYEKPMSLDMSEVAPILGDSCSTGNLADTCTIGNDPAVEPYCPQGAVATGNCEAFGDDAQKICYGYGGQPGWGCVGDSKGGGEIRSNRF